MIYKGQTLQPSLDCVFAPIHARHTQEVNWCVLDHHLIPRSRLLPFPFLDYLFMLPFSSIRCRLQVLSAITKHGYILSRAAVSIFFFLFFFLSTHIIGLITFFLSHRNHTKGSNRLLLTLKHTHSSASVCVLFAPSKMYCLGKWVCAPSGWISMNKNLNA